MTAVGQSGGAGAKQVCNSTPQEDVLFASLTSRETFSFAARLRLNAPTSDIKALIDRTLKLLGLELRQYVKVHVGDMHARRLSRGGDEEGLDWARVVTYPERAISGGAYLRWLPFES
jgi:ABC-type multidrug transport system ATPase subunit